jgi:AAHS family 4-hydroxybenzoate transporter-like MFS transporter
MSERGGDDSLTVDAWLDKCPVGGLQMLVLVVTSAIMVVDGFDLQALALAIPSLSRDLGIVPEQLSWALSISLIGMGIGAALFGMLGDRFGRRTLLWTSLLVVATSCAATSFAEDTIQIGALRFITGLGIGAANINALALTTGYAPPRRRFLMMMVMGCNMGLGATVAGLAAPAIIAAWGWQGIFAVGGILPLVIALVVIVAVPESLAFVIARSNPERLGRLTARIDPGFDGRRLRLPAIAATSRLPIAELFSPSLRVRTATLWVVYALGSFTLYLLVSWLPVLLIASGWEEADALRGSVTIQLGGIFGSIVSALFIDRGHLVRALVAGYSLAAAALLLLLIGPATILIWSALIFLVGVGVAGNQLILIGVAAALYPEHLRATSAGWATAVARTGAILAPLAGGLALSARIPATQIMAALAAPMVLQILLLLIARKRFAGRSEVIAG